MNKKMISLTKHFGFIQQPGPLLVAVSGGSDSMALLFLANAWAQKTQRKIHAVTVDHGLRGEAAGEAIYVSSICEALGVPHTILAWDGIKPSSGVSAAARHARYQLINEFALDIGIKLILTGHNQDDQAETVLMRLKRGLKQPGSDGGGRGHAGMCQQVLLGGLDVYQAQENQLAWHEGVLLFRPLLGLSRQQLRDYLNQVSQNWIEDPSNFDMSYERVRVRQELATNATLKQNIVDYSQVMGRMRGNVARDAARALRNFCRERPGRVFELGLNEILCMPRPVSYLALRTVIAVAGGAPHLVSETHINKIIEGIRSAAASTVLRRQTMGNCIVEINRHSIVIFRELRNLAPALIGAGESKYWDGRVHISNNSSQTIRVEALPSENFQELFEGEPWGRGKMSVAEKSGLLSSPYISNRAGLSVALGARGQPKQATNLPHDIVVREGSAAVELFCPQWDYPLLAWINGALQNESQSDQGNLQLSSLINGQGDFSFGEKNAVTSRNIIGRGDG